MESPQAPTPPDPERTAAAQTTSNRETAVANAYLNRVNQMTPQGSVQWNVTGYNPDGTPRFESTQTYSPEEQNIFNLGQQTRANIGNIGVQQSARIGELLGTPVNMNSEVENRLYELGRSRLDPRFNDQRASLEQSLANRGITLGSEAYDRAMGGFEQSRNDAYNQLALTGRGQAVQEVLAQRNQPINEISALMSGSQVSQPNFIGTPQAQQANTDVAGIYNQNFQNQMGIYNAQMNQQNAMMGGVAGLAGNAMRFIPWSDRRLKKNIVELGIDRTGLMGVEWTYIWGGPRFRGYMAENVRELYPDAAILMPNGYWAVDYARIG
jgi:hypothetical protein